MSVNHYVLYSFFFAFYNFDDIPSASAKHFASTTEFVSFERRLIDPIKSAIGTTKTWMCSPSSKSCFTFLFSWEKVFKKCFSFFFFFLSTGWSKSTSTKTNRKFVLLIPWNIFFQPRESEKKFWLNLDQKRLAVSSLSLDKQCIQFLLSTLCKQPCNNHD